MKPKEMEIVLFSQKFSVFNTVLNLNIWYQLVPICQPKFASKILIATLVQ
jgi:hypothetical protein